MNIKVLLITVAIFTILIFGGNHYAARTGSECGDDPCQGQLKVVRSLEDPKEPSCSVIFENWSFGPIKEVEVKRIGDAPKCIDVRKQSVLLVCDRDISWAIRWGRGPEASGAAELLSTVGSPGQMYKLGCIRPGGVPKRSFRFLGDWWRGKLPDMPQFTFTQEATSPGAGQVHAASDDLPQDEGISGTYRVRVIDGDVGVERETGGHIVIVAAGEAEVQSFCTGDTLRLAGPGTLGLPTCQFDISGRWQGTYARRLSDGSLESVPFSLTLRKESGNLRGELNTPDGTFNIVSGSHSDRTLALRAEGTVAGSQRRIRLSGNVTKGGMMLEGSEDSPPSVLYKIIGFAERLYIADSALPPAAINQPYSFTLLAISPGDEALTFRLAGGQLPRGITLDGQTGTLSGTPAELGDFNVMVAASDSAGKMFEQPLTLAVKRLVLTTRVLPDAYIGQPYAATLKAAGGRPPYQYQSFGAEPPGLKLNPNTGELIGTPAVNSLNVIRFFVRVLDSQNNREDQNVSLRVRDTTILNSHFLPDATLGVPYRTQFQAVGNSSPIQWSIHQDEDDISSIGLQLNPQTGELAGTPIKAGNFLLQVTAQDQRGRQSRDFILTIEAPATGLAMR